MNSEDETIATLSATTSLVVDERERRLQKRRERERARRHCETTETREERLRKRRARDRARHAAWTYYEQRQLPYLPEYKSQLQHLFLLLISRVRLILRMFRILHSISRMESETSPLWAWSRMVVQRMRKYTGGMRTRWRMHARKRRWRSGLPALMDFKLKVVELAMKNGNRNDGREYTVSEKLVYD